jgi:hypothetical protein
VLPGSMPRFIAFSIIRFEFFMPWNGDGVTSVGSLVCDHQ